MFVSHVFFEGVSDKSCRLFILGIRFGQEVLVHEEAQNGLQVVTIDC